MGYSRKNLHSPDRWGTGNSCGVEGSGNPGRSGEGGGVGPKRSSSGGGGGG